MGYMKLKIFCRCGLLPSWSGHGLISTPVFVRTSIGSLMMLLVLLCYTVLNCNIPLSTTYSDLFQCQINLNYSVKSSAFFSWISFDDAEKGYRNCLLNFPLNTHASGMNSCKFSLSSFGYLCI